MSSSTTKTSSAFGRKRDSKMRPRYSCVIPRWRPWPTASITVTPTCPVASSTASITVSMRSRITTASTFTMRRLLAIEVEGELRGMRAQADRVHLVLPLPRDPRRDQVLGEHAPAGQEPVVGLERVERAAERVRHLRHVGARLVEEVVVGRVAG